MIEALQQNDFRLPEYVQYNNLNIPFAYPPLAFYLAGLISKIFNISIFNILLWMPAAILIAVIPAIFQFAKVVLKSQLQAGLTALIYALLPRSITWLIMGGGVTRSLGQLFLVLASINLYLLFTAKVKQKKHLILSILFFTLVCITHPEATIHITGIALIIWLFYGRNIEGVINSILVALGTLMLTSPWWLTILLRFGPSPYISAAQTGLNSTGYFFRLFLPFSGEPFLTIIALLAVLGLTVQIAKGEFLLPLLYIIPFIIEPRNAPNVSIIPMALLAAISLTDLLLPTLAKIESGIKNIQFDNILQSQSEKFLFVYLMIYLLIGMQFSDLSFRENRVSPENRKALEWIKLNTPVNSKFLILTGKNDLFADSLNEWFPVLTNRISLTTIQGYEWMGNGVFAKNVKIMQDLQQCTASNQALNCIEFTSKEAGYRYDYLYIPRESKDGTARNNLEYALQNSNVYASVYVSKSALIFKKKSDSN
jgi:hypothetical protein